MGVQRVARQGRTSCPRGRSGSVGWVCRESGHAEIGLGLGVGLDWTSHEAAASETASTAWISWCRRENQSSSRPGRGPGRGRSGSVVAPTESTRGAPIPSAMWVSRKSRTKSSSSTSGASASAGRSPPHTAGSRLCLSRVFSKFEALQHVVWGQGMMASHLTENGAEGSRFERIVCRNSQVMGSIDVRG